MLARTDIVDVAQDFLRTDAFPKVLRRRLYYGGDCECEESRVLKIWLGLQAVRCADVLTSDDEQAVLGGLQILTR